MAKEKKVGPDVRAVRAKAREEVADKLNRDATSPAVEPVEEEIDTSKPKKKKGKANYEKFASNRGRYVRNKLDDKTEVEPGNEMENEYREPAHELYEIAVETDAPGFKQANALMTPRGNPHYDDGGAVADITAPGADTDGDNESNTDND